MREQALDVTCRHLFQTPCLCFPTINQESSVSLSRSTLKERDCSRKTFNISKHSVPSSYCLGSPVSTNVTPLRQTCLPEECHWAQSVTGLQAAYQGWQRNSRGLSGTRLVSEGQQEPLQSLLPLGMRISPKHCLGSSGPASSVWLPSYPQKRGNS